MPDLTSAHRDREGTAGGRPAGRVVVTGAAAGIGAVITTHLAATGWQVAAVDRDADGLDRLAGAAPDRDLVVVQAELEHSAQAKAAVDEAVARLGGLDGLVNNAGGSAHTALRFEEVDEVQFYRVVGWNLKSAFFCTQAALRHLRASVAPSIVNIGAIAGRAGTDLLPAQYSAAKAGVIGFTRNVACQLGPEGIRVNVVSPGFTISGERVERLWREREDQEQILRRIPLRRRGCSEEVAGGVAYLLGPGRATSPAPCST